MIAVIGIDPGVHGGLTLLNPLGGLVYVRPVPETEDELCSLLRIFAQQLSLYDSDACFIEKVGFIKGDGGKGSFTFGRIYGALRMGVRSNGLRIYDVPPVIWQSRLGCLTGGDKNISKDAAIRLFGPANPGLRITHAIADSMLIARYGWLQLAQRLPPSKKPAA